jgi:transcriptional regulator with AAA-type ATPase domain
MPNNIINASSAGSGGLITTAADSGSLEIQSNGTTIMTIGSTGVTTQIGAPAFSAYSTVNQTTTIATFTKIQLNTEQANTLSRLYNEVIPVNDSTRLLQPVNDSNGFVPTTATITPDFHEHIEVEESLSLEDREKELIQKALEKHKGKRKYAASELGISERTLYRKIKEYHILA